MERFATRRPRCRDSDGEGWSESGEETRMVTPMKKDVETRMKTRMKGLGDSDGEG